MGLLGRVSGAFGRLREPDERRLAEETADWASAIPDTVRIAEAQLRQQVRVAGVVRRMTIRPIEGGESLEAVIDDGTEALTVVWTGRRAIAGLTLGSAIVAEGMLAEQHGERRIVNPKFEFAAPVD